MESKNSDTSARRPQAEPRATTPEPLRPAPLDPLDAAQAFAALGSEARLAVIRRLVRAGPSGMTVGALQAALELPASTLSHHLKFLSQCGLLTQERDGRSLICRAAFGRVEALADFLTRECCVDDGAASSGETAA